MHNKVTTEHKENKNKAEEEQYMKEERDKMALEMYENWLVRVITVIVLLLFETPVCYVNS